MPENNTQTEPYYQVHRNYPDRYRCRRARRLGVPATLLAAWYPVMHDIASNAGTFGEFTTDVRAFEEAVGEPERHGTSAEDCERDTWLAVIWRLLENAGICEIVSGVPELGDGEVLPGEFRVRVLGLAARPRRQPASDAERAKAYRERQRAERHDSSRTVTEPRDASRRHVTSRGSIHTIHTEGEGGAAHASPGAVAPARTRTHEADAPTPPSWEAQIAEARLRLGRAGEDAARFVDAAVDEQGRGTASARQRLRRWWLPLVQRVEQHGVDAVAYGLAEAVKHDRPGLGYVDQCVASFKRHGGRPVQSSGDSEAARNAAITADLERRFGQVAPLVDLIDDAGVA